MLLVNERLTILTTSVGEDHELACRIADLTYGKDRPDARNERLQAILAAFKRHRFRRLLRELRF